MPSLYSVQIRGWNRSASGGFGKAEFSARRVQDCISDKLLVSVCGGSGNRVKLFTCPAGMAELADAADSKSAEGNLVGVRPPLPAPYKIKRLS